MNTIGASMLQQPSAEVSNESNAYDINLNPFFFLWKRDEEENLKVFARFLYS